MKKLLMFDPCDVSYTWLCVIEKKFSTTQFKTMAPTWMKKGDVWVNKRINKAYLIKDVQGDVVTIKVVNGKYPCVRSGDTIINIGTLVKEPK